MGGLILIIMFLLAAFEYSHATIQIVSRRDSVANVSVTTRFVGDVPKGLLEGWPQRAWATVLSLSRETELGKKSIFVDGFKPVARDFKFFNMPKQTNASNAKKFRLNESDAFYLWVSQKPFVASQPPWTVGQIVQEHWESGQVYLGEIYDAAPMNFLFSPWALRGEAAEAPELCNVEQICYCDRPVCRLREDQLTFEGASKKVAWPWTLSGASAPKAYRCLGNRRPPPSSSSTRPSGPRRRPRSATSARSAGRWRPSTWSS